MYVDEGLTLRKIGEKFGFSRQTVCYAYRCVGIRAVQKWSKAGSLIQRQDGSSG